MNFIEIRNFRYHCCEKEMPSHRLEENIANRKSNKGCACKNTSNSQYSTIRKQTTQLKKSLAKYLNKHITKGDMWLANIKHVKKVLNSISHKEMQIKSAVRYHLTLWRNWLSHTLMLVGMQNDTFWKTV